MTVKSPGETTPEEKNGRHQEEIQGKENADDPEEIPSFEEQKKILYDTMKEKTIVGHAW